MTAKSLPFYDFSISAGCKKKISNLIKEYFVEPPETSWVDRLLFKERFNALKNGYLFTPQISLYIHFGFDSEELEDILIALSDGNLKKCEMIFEEANKSIKRLILTSKNPEKFYEFLTAEDLITIFLSVQELLDSGETPTFKS